MTREFKTIENIKIYTGNIQEIRETHEKNIQYFKGLITQNLFTPLQPSTLTAQGQMTNIQFEEKDIIDMLSDPTGQIMMIGCNYGEKRNPLYVPKVVVKKSNRGRKALNKKKTKRKTQGTGNYFSSQITFVIQHPRTKINYKIKLFRNGVFQVPGVCDPSMSDLVEPVIILKDYLAYNFDEDVQITNFTAVMRNYKSKLLNDNYHVDLEQLERIISSYKLGSEYINYLIRDIPQNQQNSLKKFIGKTNPLNVAEITYNTDRCFCLILKFYRPMINDKDKKTTVKLLKKGKINFDGGNSEEEINELYHWLKYIYSANADRILIDIHQIKNTYNDADMLSIDPDTALYDSSDSLD